MQMPARLNGTINKQNTGVRDILKNRPVGIFLAKINPFPYTYGDLYQE